MALTTNFNADPYYDDYNQDDAYYRILFRPGFAVQAREVTQLQTILQKQVERYGKHTFQDGSIVLGCELNYDNNIKTIQLETQFSGADITIGDFADGIVTGGTSNARAVVVSTAATTTTDQPVIVVNYLNNNTFQDGETITVEGSTTQANSVSSTGAAGISTGAQTNAAVVSCQSGVFFVGGYFVFKEAESIILEKFSSTPSYRVGFQVTESIVTSDVDGNLLDPAQGAYNYAAAGANRFKIALGLSAKTYTAEDAVEAAADENFYQLLKLNSGVKIEETNYPIYSDLEKTLARRTYDESGDYTLTPFNLELKTHQGITGTTANSGSSATSTLTGNGSSFDTELEAGDVVYLSGNTAQTAIIASITNSTVATLTGTPGTLVTATSGQTIKFESKLSAGLDPGKAYVKGYEYESISTKYITVDKGRDTLTVNSYNLSTAYGNKLHIKQANGYFDIARHQIVDLYMGNVATQNVSGSGTEDSVYGTTFSTRNSQTKIGTARVRDIDFLAASGNTANVTHSQSDYSLYLYDIRTANSKTGTVADTPREINAGSNANTATDGFMPIFSKDTTSSTFEPRKDIITIGTNKYGNTSSVNYLTGGGSTNTAFAKLAQVSGVYEGATITIVTPSLNKMLGFDSTYTGVYGISLEHNGYTLTNEYDKSLGSLLLEDQTTDVSNTTYARTISNYTANGDVAIVQVDSDMTHRPYFSSNSTGGAITGECSTFEVSFQIKDIDSVAVTSTSARTSDAEVDETSRYNNVATANTVLENTQLNSLLFPLPDKPLSLANNITYTYKDTTTLTTDAGGVRTFTLSGTDTFTDTGTPISTANAEENFVVVVADAKSDASNSVYTKVSNGQYLSFSNTDGVGRTINVASTSAVIDCNTTSAIDISVTYTAKKVAQTGSGKTKAIIGGIVNTAYNYSNTGGANQVHTWSPKGQYFVDAPSRITGVKIDLPVYDVFNLIRVVDSGSLTVDVSNSMMIASANDITSSYSLDTGQTDNFYGHASVQLRPGKTPPSGKIAIVFDRFTHSGSGFFTVNSYMSQIGANISGRNSDDSRYNANSKIFTYGDIPKYTSPVSGTETRLTDVIDWRPYVQDDTHDGTTATTYYLANNTDAIANSSILLPDSDTEATLDYSYYVPRIDKLTLTRDRTFEIIKGVASSNPVAPPDSEDSMTLYTLGIPAYTFSLVDIETRYIDNKRFTMRDVGKLEKRIERMEYYTSLNLLEIETAARDISSDIDKDSLLNSTGARFKNGILIDPFAGHSIGDVALDDYKASINFREKKLRAPFYSDNFRFTYDATTSNNTVKTGDLITLPYTNATFIDQPLYYSSYSINPFNITNFIGNVKLDPPSDTWFDDTTRPDVVTNLEGHHDNWALSPSDGRVGFGSQWNDWSVNWSGEQINPEPQSAISNGGASVISTRSTKTISQNKTKFGVQADNPVETIVKSVGNRTVDMSIIPYVRAQRISFAAKGLKPFTNVYVYIGSTDVAANTEPAKKLVFSAANGAFQEGEVVKDSANNQGIVRIASNTVSNVATIFITDITGNTSATLASPVTSQNNRATNSSIGFAAANVITGQTTGANGTISSIVANSRGLGSTSKMQTDGNGTIAGDINIAAGTFRTGDRIIRLTDQANNELASTTTVAEELFKAKGLFNTRDKLAVSTREVLSRRESLTSEDIVVDSSTRQSGVSNYLNPLSQTFFVEPNNYPMGVFLKHVSLYFYAKDSNLPVTVQIRPVINGIPSASHIIPFSEKTLNPDSVTANTSTPTATTFIFDSPVYLATGEYALTVLSNSSQSKLWSAQIGQNSSGTTRIITHQPFVGKLYGPSNAGTWKEDTGRSLMFNLARCNFTGTGGVNNYAVFSSHANGAVGNTANVLYQTFKTTSSTIEFSNTNVDYQFKSYDTTNTAVDYTGFSTDQNILLTSGRQMTSDTNGMFLVNASMSTSNSHVSPIIDLDRLSVITIDNDIDNAGISANDIIITTLGSGYTNTAAAAYSGTISAPDLADGTTATVNVQVEVTLSVNTASAISSNALMSANSDYTVNASAAGSFVIGEGVRIVANTAGGEVSQSEQSGDAAHGIISDQTFVGSDSSKNVATITIKTSSNNEGHFQNGVIVFSDSTAQDGDHTNSQVSVGSNTFMAVNVVTGVVANVVPIETGSGYLTTPTVSLSTNATTNATANIVGEDSAQGGNINAKYISRRVTLEDGFDASDLKVILNTYKPLGTAVHLYYKAKGETDPEDFDTKGYVLMTQETPSSIYSGSEDDIKEFIYKTSGEEVKYTSNGVTYDTFKTFAVKAVMTSNNVNVIPKVRDIRIIALD